jgi:succinyl-CoA synthetase beta subunit/citryl-CoA synthetase large subunit
MTRLLEDLSLALLQEHGVSIPRVASVSSPAAAAACAAEWGVPVVVKALVPAGKRQLGGAVRFADTPLEAERVAASLLGQTFQQFPIDRVLVAERLPVRRELFVSLTFDARHCGPLLLFSSEGGIHIERHVEGTAAALVQRPIDITLGLRPFEAREVADQAGLDGVTQLRLADILLALYRAFRATDAQLIEVNPLAEVDNGRLVALSAVVVADNQARFRQRQLFERAGDQTHNGVRPLTALEQQVQAIDAADPSVGPIRFNEFADGDIALMITGGGAGLTALDAIYRYGGRPATSFDIKIGQSEDKMYAVTRAVLGRPGLKALLVGANYSNFTGIDIKVRGVVRALRDARIDTTQFPVIMRFCGANQEVARAVATALPGVVYLDHTATIEDAVELAVQRAYSRPQGEA